MNNTGLKEKNGFIEAINSLLLHANVTFQNLTLCARTCFSKTLMFVLISVVCDLSKSCICVKVTAAAAPPPAATLEAVQKMGFDVTHVYGLTETYGHVSVCAWQDQWNALSASEQSDLRSRQGVKFPMMEGLAVMNPETMTHVKKAVSYTHVTRPRNREV